MGCQYQARNIDRLLAHAMQQEGEECPAELIRHLENCLECARLASEQRAVWRRLEAWEAPQPSARFEAALWRRIKSPEPVPYSWQEKARHWLRWHSRPVLPVAAVCATLAVAATLSMPWPTRPRPAVHPDKVDIEQVENSVNDLDLLRSLTPMVGVTPAKRDASL